MVEGKRPSAGNGGPAMTVTVSVTVTEVREDGTAGPLEEELAAALAGPVEQFSSMLTWTAQQAAPLISAAGIRHGTIENGCDRGVVSIFGPVRAGRMAYRNRREANLYPADARWILPEDPYSMGMRALVAYHLAEGGYGQAQEGIAARTGVTAGRAQLAGIAQDLAGWVDEFYDQRAFGADTDLPASDVIMMQADGKGIAVRPGHRASAGKDSDSAHPGIKKMAEIVAVADFTPAVREPEDIAAPPARRKERPGPQA